VSRSHAQFCDVTYIRACTLSQLKLNFKQKTFQDRNGEHLAQTPMPFQERFDAEIGLFHRKTYQNLRFTRSQT
jgi:hypothetical protein